MEAHAKADVQCRAPIRTHDDHQIRESRAVQPAQCSLWPVGSGASIDGKESFAAQHRSENRYCLRPLCGSQDFNSRGLRRFPQRALLARHEPLAAASLPDGGAVDDVESADSISISILKRAD